MTSNSTKVFICGSALSGQPDNTNLQGATLIKAISTAPLYRLHSVGDGWHPGIYRVEEKGIAIPGELYDMTSEQFSYLEKNEPPNMYAEDILLEDGSTATAFLYPQVLIEKHGWPDVSHYGGWTAYKAANS